MTPIIRDGDSVKVVPLNNRSLKSGAILLCRHYDRLILHRLIRKQPHLLLCGDAVLSGYEQVPREEILGVAIEVKRGRSCVQLDTFWSRLTGLLWHLLRPARRVYFQLRSRRIGG